MIGDPVVAVFPFVVQGYAMDGKVDAVCAIVDCDTNLEGVVRFFLDGYAGPEFLDQVKHTLDCWLPQVAPVWLASRGDGDSTTRE